MNACECDFDFDGDPGRYVKCTRFCPVHDECEWCGARPGVQKLADPTDARFYSWVCAACAAQPAEMEAAK